MLTKLLRALAMRRRPVRDRDGRFAPINQPRAIDAAKILRAEVESKNPDHKWRYDLG